MSPFLLSLSAGSVRLWVHLYTTGLPASIRQGRRSEIDSDLWDQVGCADATTLATAGHVFLRMLLGIPSDITWQLAALGGTTMERSFTSKAVFGGIVILAGLSVLAGVGLLIGLAEGSWSLDDDGGYGVVFFLAVIAGLIGPFAALAGAYEMRRAQAEGRSPSTGRTLVVVGTLGIAAIAGAMWWTIVGPLVAAAIIAYWMLQFGGWPGGSHRSPSQVWQTGAVRR